MAEQGWSKSSVECLRGSTVFIISLGDDDGYFFLDFEGNPARGVRALSAATRFKTYLEADGMNASLRKLGYDSVVCNVFGEPVDREALRNPVLSPKPRIPKDLEDYEENFTTEEIRLAYYNPCEEFDEFRAAVDRILETKFK